MQGRANYSTWETMVAWAKRWFGEAPAASDEVDAGGRRDGKDGAGVPANPSIRTDWIYVGSRTLSAREGDWCHDLSESSGFPIPCMS